MGWSIVPPGSVAIGGVPTRVDLKALKRRGFTAVLDLNGSDDERKMVEALQMKYEGHTIPDDHLPLPPKTLIAATLALGRLLMMHRGVFVHCMEGKGRSPTVAAAFLITLGVPVEEAATQIQEHRKVAWEGSDGIYRLQLDRFEDTVRKAQPNRPFDADLMISECRELVRGTMMLPILRALADQPRGLSEGEIKLQVEEKSLTMYQALHALEADGLVEKVEGHFRLSEKGRDCLEGWDLAMRAVVETLNDRQT